MLAHPVTAVVLILVGQSAPSSASEKHPKAAMNDFMRAMDIRKNKRQMKQRKLKHKGLRREHISKKRSSAELLKKIIEKSIFVRPGERKLQEYKNQNDDYNQADNNENDDINQAYQDDNSNDDIGSNNYNANQDAKADYGTGTEEANANYENGNYNRGNNNGRWNNYQYGKNYNNYNNANYWQKDAQANYDYQEAQANNNYQFNENGEKVYKYDANYDGMDDYFMAYGEWENEFGFDPTQFSLSYHRCAAVRQFDDMIAAQEDTNSVFSTKHFAIFRFCPEQTCMGWQEEDQEIYCDVDYYGKEYCAYMREYAEYIKYYEEQEYQKKQEEQNQNGQYQYDYNKKWNGQKENGKNQNDRDLDNEDEEGRKDEGDGVEEVEKAQQGKQMDRRYNGYYRLEQEDDNIYYGARGDGCQHNYGEYMLEMELYVTLMAEWQQQRFQTYCEYCEQCMFRVYEEWLANGGQRKLTYEEFKASEDHNRLRLLSDEHQVMGNYYNVCPEYDTCAEYQKVCQHAQGNYTQSDYTQYFECQQVKKNNGIVAWVGPHCAQDGFTITLGIYGDQYCSEYIGNGVNIANFIGEEIDWEEDMLKSYYNSAHGTLDQLKYINEDNVCIPCNKADLMWERQGNNDNYDGGDSEVNKAYSEVNEICGSLYEVSARCDKHYRSYNTKSKQAKYAEAVAQEDLTCDFIDSVVMGNYNEMGYIDLGQDYTVEGQPGWMGNNIYAQQYGQYVSQVTPLQVFGLFTSVLAVGGLAAWSSTLNRSLSKTGPWRPRRALRGATPSQTDFSRQNSGIVMGRSRSNASYYMT